MNYIVREFDPITYDKDLEILSENNYPLFCGVTQKDISEDIIAKLCWAISKKSGVIFLKKLIPLEILYKNGHDAGSIGKLWEEHHKSFAEFVMGFSPKNIVEIGGGHGKIALECFKINQSISYTIIEPNSNFKHPNINYIDDFFSPKFLDNQNFDCIIHSHTFEHIYEPHLFLEQINSVVGGGIMIFSLPNMQKWLENKWTNCLNFEHTIFLNEKVIEFLLVKNSFKILKKFYFNEHSIFYATIKNEKIKKENLSLINEYQANKKLFMDMQDYYQRQITRLNEYITKFDLVYIFGAHLFSQYLIYQGLKTQKIAGILDNNPNKQGKRLYGTKFFVFSPKILIDKEALIILNAGVYNEEIKRDLLEINKSLQIIDF